MVRGNARVIPGQREFDVPSSQSRVILVETGHHLENHGTEMLTIIEAQCSGYLGEDDIVPLAGRYGRILA